METLYYKISINAPVQKVWETMLDAKTYVLWIDGPNQNTYFVGTWGLNQELKFISDSGAGTLVLIEDFRPYEYISARHIALIDSAGESDNQSAFAISWINQTESYLFEERNNFTELTLVIEANSDWTKMYNDIWPGALKRLQKLCET